MYGESVEMSVSPESSDTEKEIENQSDKPVSDDGGDIRVEVSETTDTDGSPGVEELTAQLEALQAKADGYLNDVMRARADAENLRKRTARDVENAHKYGQERFVVEILPVKDSMDLGMAAAESATDMTALREGMSLTLKAFNQALEKLGVVEVNPLGEKFDPDLHQAISMQPAEGEANRVINVIQKGYRLHDRLIRPALVIVSAPTN